MDEKVPGTRMFARLGIKDQQRAPPPGLMGDRLLARRKLAFIIARKTLLFASSERSDGPPRPSIRIVTHTRGLMPLLRTCCVGT
jgi:hypothetical protein